MIAASDTGSSNTDNATRINTPAIAIAAPGAGETPSLYVDGVKVAATFDPATNTLTPTVPLADGPHSVTYTLTNANGESAQSPALAVVIDTIAPAAPGASVDASTDSGVVGDNITNGSTPKISGAGATPGDVVTVTTPKGEVLTTTVAADGTWSVTPTTPLDDGA